MGSQHAARNKTIKYYSRSLEPLCLKSGREVGRETGKLAAEGSDTLRPHGVPLGNGQR